MEIKGKVALVTGGAQGLGRSIAEHFLELGARVLIADKDEAALQALPEAMGRYALNIKQPAEVKLAVATIFEQHGSLDILINNAGVIFNEPLVNMMNPGQMMHDYDRFRASIVSNLDSVFIMTSAVVEQMVRRRVRGAIVNISSISARGNEGQSAYSAAKAGVEALTRTWSKELGRLGIRCNAVAPGFIDTESTRRALSESTIKHIQSNTPLRRLGKPTDVAKAVEALVSNDFITGEILNVNGGLSI